MSEAGEEFYLLIGGAKSESATSRIATEGLRYERKLLESGPDNWRKTIELLRHPGLKGAIVALTAYNYELLVGEKHADVGTELLDALKDVPHVVFVHEAVFFNDNERSEETTYEDPSVEPFEYGRHWYDVMTPEEMFGVLPEAIRARVNEMLFSRQINVLPYKKNTERSTMAGTFLEDLDRHLLFRIYVPTGRLYAGEADTLLGLFRDWLNRTGRNVVRQDGYNTPSGHVYEFFGKHVQNSRDLTQQFRDFSNFLDACADAPEAAVTGLLNSGIDRRAADLMVSRYAKAGRRLQLDLRQTREERVLALKHELEAELLDNEQSAAGTEVEQWLESVVPHASNSPSVMIASTAIDPRLPAQVQVNVHQQVFQNMRGTVIQNLQGTVNLGPEAQELLDLIRAHGGSEAVALESALHELEDPDARTPERVVARQKLRKFVSSVGPHISKAGLSVLQKYLEHKLGL